MHEKESRFKRYYFDAYANDHRSPFYIQPLQGPSLPPFVVMEAVFKTFKRNMLKIAHSRELAVLSSSGSRV